MNTKTLCLTAYPASSWRLLPVLGVLGLMFLIFPGYAPLPQTQAAAASCEDLKNLALPNTTITLAQSLPAGPNPPPVGTLPAPICRVVATLSPTSDSKIQIEVWMPAMRWNGNLLGVGNGGFSGSISYGGLLDGVRRGYATASTDTGHMGSGAEWGPGHPEKVTDFAYRAVHEMTVRSKALVQGFYGNRPRFSYWNGCSSGGKQGLKEAQVYPDDYEGIVAGAPANNWSHLHPGQLYVALTTLKNGITGAEYIPPSKYQVITNAALAACDGLDGVMDGLLADPTRCRFDPSTLLCPGADAATCLTAPQVESVRKIYAGAKFSNGREFYPGLPPSSEFAWGALAAGPEPFGVAVNHFKYLVFGDSSWDWHTFNPDRDVPLADSVQAVTFNSMDPNLLAFKARGGKLIMYHGWIDQLIAAQNSVNYYQSVVAAMGGARETQDFFRLFMVPGMLHCGSGPGPNVFDTLGALERWVEQGIAPDQIIASHSTGGRMDRTRPLCPYPQVAVYKGAGNINDAANFVCQTPPGR